uniref:UBX domain-containing protein 6 n=1 Tax=Nothoprocta perdicaria TaxID=30464 RepID=A0A8C6ZIE2_NOTPE
PKKALERDKAEVRPEQRQAGRAGEGSEAALTSRGCRRRRWGTCSEAASRRRPRCHRSERKPKAGGGQRERRERVPTRCPSAREKHVREAILAYFAVDPVAASIMEIHTFNKDRERVRAGVETMARYLDNIYVHPEEEKYRKIKLQNKVFQERISCLEGTHKFFQAVGFETKVLAVPEQEEYYVLKEEMLTRLEDLKDYKEQLLSSEPVRAQLDRQLSVFKPSPAAAHFELPNDFYNLTAEEIKREQRLRSEAVEKASMLRTKAMRERDEQRELRKYNYTLLRVRFPDGYILQGTFYARESISMLYSFVREALVNDWLPFELLGPGGVKLTDENLAFSECGLVPSSLLTLVWDASVMADIQAAGEEQPESPLKPQLLSQVQTLS